MLWSLTKVLIFVAMVAALAFGAGQLMETSGGITIAIGGVEVTLSVLQATLGLLLLILAVWLFLKVFSLVIAVLKFINGDETAFSRYFDRSRERRGIDALSDGLVALASGDGKTAMAKAKKADKLLNKPDVTNLVIAQAAEQSGDKRVAEETYKELLNHDRTRFVGVRGLLQQKLDAGDTDTALKLAEKAFALQPKHEATQDTLLKLQTTDEDWTGARKTLATKLKHGAMPRDLHRRRDAIMALSEARVLREAGKMDDAHALAIEANRLSPDLVPGVVLTAKAYVEEGKPKLATRVIKAAWATVPHPEIAAAFAAIEPDETTADRVKRFKALVKTNPSHSESKMVMAEAHIANEDYAAARAALGDLVDVDPTMRSSTILAAIERGEQASDDVVRDLLTRALSAPRDPEWICDACGEAHKDWEAVCLNCEGFDTIAWKRPSQSATLPMAVLPVMAAAPALPVADEPVVEIVKDVQVITDQSADVEKDGAKS